MTCDAGHADSKMTLDVHAQLQHRPKRDHAASGQVDDPRGRAFPEPVQEQAREEERADPVGYGNARIGPRALATIGPESTDAGGST